MLDPLMRRITRSLPADADDGRAPYALPRGVPALQDDPAQLRRRLLMGIAFAALLAGGAGFVAGRRSGGRIRD